MVSSKLLSVAIYVSERCFGEWFEVVGEMDQVAVLAVDSYIILIVFVLINVGEALLEVKGVSHQIEEQSQEEVSPVLLESLPPSIFTLVHTVAPPVALRHNFRSSASDHVGGI